MSEAQLQRGTKVAASPGDVPPRRTVPPAGVQQEQAADAKRWDAEECFRELADQSRLMFWVREADGRCALVSQGWIEFTGYSAEEAANDCWSALHPDDVARVRAAAEPHVMPATERREYRLRRRDGVYRWVLEVATPRLRGGQFAGYTGWLIDITDEREERDELARERSQMQMALNAARIGTFEWDISSGRLRLSHDLKVVYGFDADAREPTYRDWVGRIDPLDAERVEEEVQRCLKKRVEETGFEFRALLPDGTRRWFEAKVRFMFEPDGTPQRMIGINIDIEERKRAERHAAFLGRLAQEYAVVARPEQILATVTKALGRHLGAAGCYFVRANEAGSEVAVEQAWARDESTPPLSGRYALAEFGGGELWEQVKARTVAVDDVQESALTAHLGESYAAIGVRSWASSSFTRDGQWSASLVVVDDRPRHWRPDETMVVETVLARVWPRVEGARSEQAVARAELMIRDSEERRRVAIAAAQLGTWDCNLRTGELRWDERCKQLYGLPPDARVDLNVFLARVHPDDHPNVAHFFERALGAENIGFQEIEYRTAAVSGRPARWLRASGRTYAEAGEPVRFIGTVLDITEMVKARESLAERRRELEQTVAERTARLQETIAELEGFSYSISHDLRAPLRAMQSFAEIIEQECGPQLDAHGHDYLRRIISASERMDRLIRDVLVYSRVSRTELELTPVHLERLIDGILESYPQLQSSAADIVVQRPLPTVRANEAALTQCLSNLLGNAVKFMVPGRRPIVTVWAETEGARAKIFVRDNGIGIAPEAQEKIFNIFERLSRDYEGTGIGLAVVRKAAERMQGTVTVQSQPGTGSTFCLDLALP